MKLVKATEEDNERILHFFSQSPVPGSATLRLRRMFNFFNQYRLQTQDYVTYLLVDDRDQVQAMASLLFRSAVVDGHKEIVGYATDLRVAPHRKAILTWTQYFLPVIETERAKRNCRYIFSVISSSQSSAYNAFIRPRLIRRQIPRYHLFRRFQLVTLHGLWPFHSQPLSGIRLRHAKVSDQNAIAEYIVQRTKDRPLRLYDSAEDFSNQLDRWHDLRTDNFILAENQEGKIIGCVAPWSSERIQRIHPLTYNAKAQNLHDVLWFLSWFGWARPIAGQDREFEFRYLTHLYADNPDIFYSLLYQAYKMSGKSEFLVYPHFEGELLTRPPQSFLSAETDFGLYCILSPTDPIPDFLKPKALNQAPVFEPAFI